MNCLYCNNKLNNNYIGHNYYSITILCNLCEATNSFTVSAIHTRHKDVNIQHLILGQVKEIVDIEYNFRVNKTHIEIHNYSDDMIYSKKEYLYDKMISYKKHLKLLSFQ